MTGVQTCALPIPTSRWHSTAARSRLHRHQLRPVQPEGVFTDTTSCRYVSDVFPAPATTSSGLLACSPSPSPSPRQGLPACSAFGTSTTTYGRGYRCAQPDTLSDSSATSLELPPCRLTPSPSPRKYRQSCRHAAWRLLRFHDTIVGAAGVQPGAFSASATRSSWPSCAWSLLCLRGNLHIPSSKRCLRRHACDDVKKPITYTSSIEWCISSIEVII